MSDVPHDREPEASAGGGAPLPAQGAKASQGSSVLQKNRGSAVGEEVRRALQAEGGPT